MRDELLRIDMDKIVYFQADGNYTDIVMANGQHASICMNLASMEKVLADNYKERSSLFARVGKSAIVNLVYVYHINLLRHRLVLSDGATFSFNIEVSKEALKKLKEIMIRIRI